MDHQTKAFLDRVIAERSKWMRQALAADRRDDKQAASHYAEEMMRGPVKVTMRERIVEREIVVEVAA